MYLLCIVQYIQDTHAHTLVLYFYLVEVHTHTDVKCVGLGQRLIDTSRPVHRSVHMEVSNHTTLTPPTVLARKGFRAGDAPIRKRLPHQKVCRCSCRTHNV